MIYKIQLHINDTKQEEELVPIVRLIDTMHEVLNRTRLVDLDKTITLTIQRGEQ